MSFNNIYWKFYRDRILIIVVFLISISGNGQNVYTRQPVNRNICSGASTTFSVAVSSSVRVFLGFWQVKKKTGAFSAVTDDAFFSQNFTTRTLSVNNNVTSDLDGYIFRYVVQLLTGSRVYSNEVTLRVFRRASVASVVACDSFTWIDGITYTENNNTATFTRQNAAGCPEIITLDLTINKSSGVVDRQTACDSYTWIDGVAYTENNNTATFTRQNVAGCTEIVTLDLTINKSSGVVDRQVACDSYTWIDGVTYTENNNTATFTRQNAAGCPEIVTLDLIINKSSGVVDRQTACDSYTWLDGVTYAENNNTATFTRQNAAGCSEIVTLDLTINKSSGVVDRQVACDSYTWIDGITYTENNNTATFTRQNAAGCTEIVTLDLTINKSYAVVDRQTACESYLWLDGITYTENNNTATFTRQNVAGCPEIVTLDLTINKASGVVDRQIACESYLWLDGITYTENNNTATFTRQNAAGCTEIVTLDLTINKASDVVDRQIACESYLWIDGITYTENNNTATFTRQNAVGCTETVTLDLMISKSSEVVDRQAACDSYTWIDGITYTENNNTATFTRQNVAGCPEIVTLDLTINTNVIQVDSQTAYDYFVWIDGKKYTQTNNTAVFKIQKGSGCEEVIRLDLTIIKSSYDEIVVSNIVTPNGDGTNDYWKIQGIESYQDNSVWVYDKAGRVVYFKSNYMNDWDCSFRGEPLQNDTYYYLIELGRGIPSKKGYVTIITN